MQDYEQAKVHFAEALRLVAGDKDALRETDRIKARLQEQTTGVYGFAAIRKSVSTKTHDLDYATFTANVVVGHSGSRGRGLFATKQINPGDLILCEKAFTTAYSSHDADTYTILNLNTNHGAVGTQATLLFSTVQKMLYSQEQARKFFDLYDGGYSPNAMPRSETASARSTPSRQKPS